MQFHRQFIAALGATLFVIASSVAVSPRIAVAGKIFFSTSNSLNGTVTVGNPTVTFNSPNGNGTLHIWVTDETPVTPPPLPNLSSSAFAFRLSRSGGTAGFTNVQVSNFTLHSTIAATGADLGPTPQNRWTSVSVNPLTPESDAIAIAAVSQAGAGTPGFNPLNDGFHLNPGSAINGTLDPGYDAAGHAFLHGQIDYNFNGAGTTIFNLEASPLGITVGHDDISSQFTYGFATVTVVPEPMSFVLLILGGMAVAGRPRSRMQRN
jgi:hypothetical protein